MRQLLPFVTGVLTLVVMWLAGSRRTSAWVVGLVNQVLWIAFIVVFEAWGLLPLSIALIFIYGRNLLRWRREDQEATAYTGNALEDYP